MVAEVLFTVPHSIREFTVAHEGPVRIRLSFITPDRWLADFAQISIRDDVRPLIVKENAVKRLQLNENRA